MGSARSDCDVIIVGGGPAGLSAAAFCGRKFLSTAVFEGESWGGILTRYCPDKKIDNYPGAPRGVRAGRLADMMLEAAKETGAHLIEEAVEEISPNGVVRSRNRLVRGKVVILACGSTAAQARVPGETALAERGAVYYRVPDPLLFRGRRVVVIGGGDTAVSHVQRLAGVAERVTLVHRHSSLRAEEAGAADLAGHKGVSLLFGTEVERILGTHRAEGVRARDLSSGRIFDVPADAVVVAAGRVPNTALLGELGLELDGRGRIVTDVWQKTSVQRVLAIGDISSHLRMIITAVAQAAAAAHEAHAQVRAPYWK